MSALFLLGIAFVIAGIITTNFARDPAYAAMGCISIMAGSIAVLMSAIWWLF